MQQQMALQGSGHFQAVLAQIFPRRSTRTSVLRQAQARRAARSSGSQTGTTDSDTWSSSEGEFDTDDSDSEASSGGRGREAKMGRKQQPRTGREQQVPPASASSEAAAALAEPAGPAASPRSSADQGPILHQPYSHLSWCQGHFHLRCTVGIGVALCTDIEELHSNGSCSVEVSFVKHPADWDVKGYILQHPVMQHQTAMQPSASAAGSTNPTQVLGPLEVTLMRRATGHTRLKDLPKQTILRSLQCVGAPHTVVLQERLSSSGQPRFVLHVMPDSSSQVNGTRQSNPGGHVRRAGEGQGLQVFPGSLAEVAQATVITLHKESVRYSIPKVLICSQLPADTTYPLKLTLTLNRRIHSPGQQTQASQQLGQWQARAYKQRNSTSLEASKGHAFAAYAGCTVATACLSQDPTQGVRLTLTLADTAPADPTPAASARTAADSAHTAPTSVAADLPNLTAAAAAAPGPQGFAPGLLSPSPAADVSTPPAGVPCSSPRSRPLALSSTAAAAASPAAGVGVPGAAAHQPQLGVVTSSAPSQQQPALPAKRLAAELEGSGQQRGGCIAAAAPGAGVSAAALPLATPSRSKKPRLHVLLPADAAGTAGARDSMGRTTRRPAAALCASTAAAAGQGCSPMQIDPPAQRQQQQAPVADPQQHQQQPPTQMSPVRADATTAVPVLSAALPAAAAVASTHPAPAGAPASATVKHEGAESIVSGPALVSPAVPAAVAAGQSTVHAPVAHAAAAPVVAGGAATAGMPFGVKQEAHTSLPGLTPRAPPATAAATASPRCPCANTPSAMAPAATALLPSVGAATPRPPAAAAVATAAATAAAAIVMSEQDIPAPASLTLRAAAAGPSVAHAAEGGNIPPPAAAAAAQAAAVQAATAIAIAAAVQAAAVAAHVLIKQEAEVLDLTADSDGEEENGMERREGGKQQQQLPATTNIRPGAVPPRSASPARSAPSQHGAPAAAAATSPSTATHQNGAATPAAPAATPATTGSLNPVTNSSTAAMPQQLPAGLVLPGAASPQLMELQLWQLLTEGLQQLLPEAQYWDLLRQLRKAFEPYRLAAAAGTEQQQQQQQQQQQLRMMYTYVQAEVRSGRLDRVVGALESLVAAACTFGKAVPSE